MYSSISLYASCSYIFISKIYFHASNIRRRTTETGKNDNEREREREKDEVKNGTRKTTNHQSFHFLFTHLRLSSRKSFSAHACLRFKVVFLVEIPVSIQGKSSVIFENELVCIWVSIALSVKIDDSF